MKKLIKWLIAPIMFDIAHDWYYNFLGCDSGELKDGTPLHIKRYRRVLEKRFYRRLQNSKSDVGVKK